MMRILYALIALVVIAAVAAAGWYYRPWSEYSPASIAALDVPEQYPETFQRMDEILPFSPVAAGAPTALPRADGAMPDSFEYNGETVSVADYAARAEIIGLTVMRDGAVIDQAFFQGADEDSLFTSWSVAKSVVATLIGKALEDGLIESLDDTAAQYAPQFEGTPYGETSLRHLLMMSAGVDFNEEYSDGQPSDIRPLFFNAFILGRNIDTMVGEVERDREPGQDLHYTSPNSHVLAAVARAVYGGRLADVVSEELWTPLGMASDATWLQNKPGEDGIGVGYCCLQATSEDYARFGEFYRVDGVWDGARLLPEGWSIDATTPRADFQEPGATRYPERGYGLHFWVPSDYDGEFYAAGVFGQYIWVDRRRGVVIAHNAGDPVWFDKLEEAYAFFRAVSEHVSPLAERVAAVNAPTAELEAEGEGQ
jgi:CubicO group peptidase (beta-lactamase class C family)